jgi:prepilin-type N-terminal cleavage/methylation domain-containing protein
MKKTNSQIGFTLIEILVVITIIGILAGILLFNFQELRKQARDKIRKSDLQSLQLAIETYKVQNGRYPAEGCSVVGPGGTTWTGPGPFSGGGALPTTCSDYVVGLVPNYIATLPTDPNQEQVANFGYVYSTDAAGAAYKIRVSQSIESDNVTSFADMYARCPKDCGGGAAVCSGAPPAAEYAVYSAGAECW